MRVFAVAAAAFGLSACVHEEITLIRLDGQPIQSSPLLQHAADVDNTVCVGETQKASLSGITYAGAGLSAAMVAQASREQSATGVFRGCMMQKGYAVVAPEQAAAAGAHYRMIQEQKQLASAAR